MPHSKAYNAGKHVHNFFATIGSGVAHGAKFIAFGIRDFGRGVKEGGPVDAKPRAAGKPARA